MPRQVDEVIGQLLVSLQMYTRRSALALSLLVGLLTAPVAWVLNKMSVGGFRHVPAVDEEGCPVIMVSVRDVVEFLVQSFPSEILNLPPEFGGERDQTRDGA